MKSWKSNLWLLVIILLIAIASGVLIYPNRWSTALSPWHYGLDLAGGTSLVYDIDMSSISSADYSSVAAGLRDVLQKRIDLYGVSDAQVAVAQNGNNYQLLVDLPGVKNLADAVNQIGQLPTLQFALLEQNTATSSTSSGYSLAPTQLTGRYITSAAVSFDSNNQPGVTFNLNSAGSQIFSDITGSNVGRPLCILIDGDLIFPNNPNLSCPNINSAITNGQAQISGGAITVDVAQQITERFNAGALAAPIKLVNEETVSATAASDALHQILIAGAIGTLAVILFMIISYGALGVFASAALLIYTALSLGVFKFLIPGFTLTLAGIAGFILSIGMAVDANILIFERSREELKKGLSWHAAIEEGFHRAWPSIRDSNISTIITSAILYFFTS
ncbi:protein translocase subunit SecD, partial [Patescibacteria group bacterium]|nr:protein translocase subunit SecD [Patescibacteria group bacterium]